MIRDDEQVMQERHLTRVQKPSGSEESSTTENLFNMNAGKPVQVNCFVVLFPGHGCSSFKILVCYQ